MEIKSFSFNRFIASAVLILASAGTIILPVWGAYTPDRYVPSGTILPFAGTTAPVGFLICDGTSYLRLSYSALTTVFSCSGSSCNYGAADSLHFNVPDLRGKFLRGTDNMGTGAGSNDPNASARTACKTGGSTGNTIGSCQGQATAVNGLHDTGHNHPLYYGGATMSGSAVEFATGSINPNLGTVSNISTTASANLAGDSETRPLNVYVNYIIKY